MQCCFRPSRSTKIYHSKEVIATISPMLLLIFQKQFARSTQWHCGGCNKLGCNTQFTNFIQLSLNGINGEILSSLSSLDTDFDIFFTFGITLII